MSNRQLDGDEQKKSVYCDSIVVSRLFLVHEPDIIDFKLVRKLVLPQSFAFRYPCFMLPMGLPILVGLRADNKVLKARTGFSVLKMRNHHED